MSEPKRIQLRRTKGWRKPEGAIVVARPSKWGNPYKYSDPAESVSAFKWTHLSRHPELIAEARSELAGRDLACWCPLDQPCHADVLLKVANS